MEFRCAATSLTDHEPLIGTAPTATRWVFIEDPGPWGHRPLAENRLPAAVRERLQAWDAEHDDLQVQLVRHHGRSAAHLPVVLAATIMPRIAAATSTTMHRLELVDPSALLTLDLDDLFAGTLPGSEPVSGQMWFVCTNGKRDRCCAEIGRPVAEMLARRWPEGTWETTHLGGHRFAGTALTLPSGHVLGRVTERNIEAVADQVLAGELPVGHTRGRTGLSGAEQVLDVHLLGGGSPDVRVVTEAGPARRQSCGEVADVPPKPTTVHRIVPR